MSWCLINNLNSTYAIFWKLSHWTPLAISLRMPSSVMLLFLRLIKKKYGTFKQCIYFFCLIALNNCYLECLSTRRKKYQRKMEQFKIFILTAGNYTCACREEAALLLHRLQSCCPAGGLQGSLNAGAHRPVQCILQDQCYNRSV